MMTRQLDRKIVTAPGVDIDDASDGIDRMTCTVYTRDRLGSAVTRAGFAIYALAHKKRPVAGTYEPLRCG